MRQQSRNKIIVLTLGVFLVLLATTSITKLINNDNPLDVNDREIIENSEEHLRELKTSEGIWTTTEVVSTESSSISYDSSIAVDGAGNAHVAWCDNTDYGGSGSDYDIFYKRWNATSSTWTTTEVVSTESAGDSFRPSIAVDGAGNAHVAWRDNTDYGGSGSDYDIFYKRWNATSSTWTTTEVVSTESTGASTFPSIAVDGTENVHVAWIDSTDYNGSGSDDDIFYKRWNSTSSTWTTTEVVSTESTDDSKFPSIAVDGTENVHVAWLDYTDYNGSGTDIDVFYKRWNATTDTWTTTEVVSTESSSNSYDPSIVVDCAGNVHVAWMDSTDYNGSGGDLDIFYKRWNVTSSTWTTTEVVSTESTGNSWTPSIVVDGAGNAHVTWYDFTDYGGSGTDGDIFYRKLANIPNTPVLDLILPNPDYDGIINLNWNDVGGATGYYIYRNTSTITSVSSLTPIATTSVSDYQDTIISNGTYYYVIIAGNATGNSSISNCESVEIILPPSAPVLNAILPNPDYDGIINLNWNDVSGATEYYIYRNTSTITSVSSLTPIATTSVSDYQDTIMSNGTYYYVIVAGNIAGNSSISNCESVEIIFAPNAPILDAIVPNPDYDGVINLNWNDVSGATEYYIYRNTSIITSVSGLTPIATTSVSNYQDIIISNGTYYYIIVAGNAAGNSSISNCENVKVELTEEVTEETPLEISGYNIFFLIGAICVISVVIFKKRFK